MNINNSKLQAPSAVVMCRPHQFISNPQTVEDNSFQVVNNDLVENRLLKDKISSLAFEEVSCVAKRLSECGVTVHLFEDESTTTPDSVFPNNWFSTHSNGMIGVYPMYSENRRKERRNDIIALLKSRYYVTDVIDYSEFENQNVFLEGTGAVVLDHINKLAYGSVSRRLEPRLFHMFCDNFGYSPILFNATNKSKVPIYHTNVLMNISTNFSMICLSMIRSLKERKYVHQSLLDSGKSVIRLTEKQVNEFAGNALELSNGKENILAISETAFNALSVRQISILQKHVSIQVFRIPTIEKAGGSIRCMLAGIHLLPR